MKKKTCRLDPPVHPRLPRPKQVDVTAKFHPLAKYSEGKPVEIRHYPRRD